MSSIEEMEGYAEALADEHLAEEEERQERLEREIIQISNHIDMILNHHIREALKGILNLTTESLGVIIERT